MKYVYPAIFRKDKEMSDTTLRERQLSAVRFMRRWKWRKTRLQVC